MKNKVNWRNVLLALTKRGKVDVAGIVSLEGQTLACTGNWDIKPAEILGITVTIGSPYPAMTKIKFFNTLFTCFHHHETGTIIGRAEHLMLVAHQTKSCVLIGLKDTDAPGSCIYEITELGKQIDRRGLWSAWRDVVANHCKVRSLVSYSITKSMAVNIRWGRRGYSIIPMETLKFIYSFIQRRCNRTCLKDAVWYSWQRLSEISKNTDNNKH